MIIAGTKVGGGERPYIIAELSCNHGGDMSRACEMIRAAKWAGADAVKTQCYSADSLTLDCRTPDFIIQDGLWRGQRLYDLYRKAATPPAWHRDLYKCAKDTGITIFSSVFDKQGVDLLESLNAPAYKIASMEIVDIPLIEYAAQTGKPLIISTGMASVDEVLDAAGAAKGKAAFLFCTSQYPTPVDGAGLHGIYDLQHLLPQNVVGVSDHSKGNMVPIIATVMNANIIERHFMLSSFTDTEDAPFSSTEDEFRDMVDYVSLTYQALQPRPPKPNPSTQLRRSLYAVKDIKKGERFTEDNVRSIRPAYGLPPKDLPRVLKKVAQKDFRRGERLTWKS
jgi:pseudaminic acid synthase